MKYWKMLLPCALLLSSCGDLGQKQHSILSDMVPGISDLDTITKDDKASDAWWDNFYGVKSNAE